MRGVLVPLSPAEEIALRQLSAGSLNISPAMVSRLVRLALIRRVAREWKLTPLGRQRLEAMPAAPLLGRASSIIADILGHYIPIAHATGIVKPEEPGKHPAAFDFGEREPRRILVAEDSYLQARALSDFLRGSGYDVVGPAAPLGRP